MGSYGDEPSSKKKQFSIYDYTTSKHPMPNEKGFPWSQALTSAILFARKETPKFLNKQNPSM